MADSTMIVAAVQLNSGADVAANLDRVASLVGKAKSRGATLVVLPENFALMGETEIQKCEVAEDVQGGNGPIITALRTLAKEHGLAIVGGGMPELSSDPVRPYNSSVYVAPNGFVQGIYRKIHLFDVALADGSVYRESDTVSAGKDVVVAAPESIPIGLSICYDVRFPELYRRLGAAGARIITVPAAFTLTTGKDHWHVLLRARAIENQVFVVAAAQHGKHPRGRATYGKSLIIDPWGSVLAEAAEGEAICVAELDFAAQDRTRSELPCLTHRKM